MPSNSDCWVSLAISSSRWHAPRWISLQQHVLAWVEQPAAAWRWSQGMPGCHRQLALPLHRDTTMCRDAVGRGVYLGLGHISMHCWILIEGIPCTGICCPISGWNCKLATSSSIVQQQQPHHQHQQHQHQQHQQKLQQHSLQDQQQQHSI